jgi:hypothetical protein
MNPPRDLTAAQAAELRAKIAANDVRTSAIVADCETDKCVALLNALRAERYSFDPAVELPVLYELNGAEREQRVAYIRRHFAQTPDEKTAEAEAAVKLATKENISYDAAVEKIRSQKPLEISVVDKAGMIFNPLDKTTYGTLTTN